MRANEFRLGNYYYFETTEGLVVETVEHIENDSIDINPMDLIKPIPLTEEWLSKFNFSVNKNDSLVYQDDNVYNGYNTGYYFHTTNKMFYFEQSILYSSIRIEYVHDFQNWYKLITGKELKLKSE